MDIKEKIIETIISVSEIENVVDILLTSDDLTLCNINSINFIKLMVEIEEVFDIEFEDDLLDYSQFASFVFLNEYVEKRIKERG